MPESARTRLATGRLGRARLICGLLAAACLAAVRPAGADSVSEYRLKAAYLFNFATFTEWPDSIGNTLAVCIYGDDPFGADIDALSRQSVGNRRIAVRRTVSADNLAGCHLVFVTRPMIGNLTRVFDRLGATPTLVVADSPGALQQGAMLNMETADGKVSFSANLAAARRQNLNLSAKLLRLATEVIQ